MYFGSSPIKQVRIMWYDQWNKTSDGKQHKYCLLANNSVVVEHLFGLEFPCLFLRLVTKNTVELGAWLR